MAERFRVYLIEKGYPHDTLQACLELKTFDNPYISFLQVEQLEKFRKTDLFARLIDEEAIEFLNKNNHITKINHDIHRRWKKYRN